MEKLHSRIMTEGEVCLSFVKQNKGYCEIKRGMWEFSSKS